ncbi:OLC1v1002873C1 [Oldenlandia corymbosa var. corymbosa]|uniref:OLC1v1002873C1 n=1 Tax=Oldenlandia corymbosa var. corymbosa TaxID=529605 RepID=A0AAV1DAF0_OLDCO|nr:OLC1v1002873C1 [Oldenlandia corymbosa var. corymbosa]
MESLCCQLWRVFVTFCFTFILISSKFHKSVADPKYSAILVFGDSYVDNGNNAYFVTLCSTNYPPYGSKYPGKPAGRPSDGKLVPDILATMLGIKEAVPPYLQPNLPNHELITGVGFASSCAGFDDRTYDFMPRISMSKQLEYFKDYISRLTTIVGEMEAQRIVSEALVIIHAGVNDLTAGDFSVTSTVNRIFQSNSSSSASADNEYQDFLMQKVQNFFEELYVLGCRRMIFMGLPPFGCVPFKRAQNLPSFQCVEKTNLETQTFNKKLVDLLPQIQAKLPGSKLVLVDIFGLVMDMIHQPNKYGFVDAGKGCCQINPSWPLCLPLIPHCSNSSQYLFWDGVHFTEAAYTYFAEEIFIKLSAL